MLDIKIYTILVLSLPNAVAKLEMYLPKTSHLDFGFNCFSQKFKSEQTKSHVQAVE